MIKIERENLEKLRNLHEIYESLPEFGYCFFSAQCSSIFLTEMSIGNQIQWKTGFIGVVSNAKRAVLFFK